MRGLVKNVPDTVQLVSRQVFRHSYSLLTASGLQYIRRPGHWL